MPGKILHEGAAVLCMHGGRAKPTQPFSRVKVSGQEVATMPPPYEVQNCGNTGSSPQCATAQWTVAAMRVSAGGVPVVITTGTAVCVPTGTGLNPIGFQTRVTAT